MKQLSIVIVNYNVQHFLELCLDSVFAAVTALDAEVIVVDNASVDASCEMVQQRFPEVILIANKENEGFSKANNQGVARAQGEYICILNPDTVIAEDTFDVLCAFAHRFEFVDGKANKKLGAVGTRLVDGTGKFLPESKRNLPTPKVALNKMFGNGDAYYARHLKHSENGNVSILVGAFMFMKTAVYREVGGFDERYFMYGEDIDLSYTIEQAGYANYYFGGLPVIHFKGESTAKDATYRKRFYGAMRIFYAKHLKTNLLEDIGVQLGTFLATLSRKRSQKPLDNQPKSYYIYSQNSSLQKLFSANSKVPVQMIETLETVPEGVEIIFDRNFTSYKSIINTLIGNQNQGVSYKIIPKNSTFAIGSNSSDGRGEVLFFK